MLAWLLWQLERMQRIHAVAGALMGEFGDDAYAEARRRERDSRNGAARDWRRVALVVARWTPGAAAVASPASPPSGDRVAHGGSAPTAPEEPPMFRIQFVCGTHDRGLANLMEQQVEAADASAAIIAAATIQWPPQTIGLRILDREGHEVFARQKARRRAEAAE